MTCDADLIVTVLLSITGTHKHHRNIESMICVSDGLAGKYYSSRKDILTVGHA